MYGQIPIIREAAALDAAAITDLVRRSFADVAEEFGPEVRDFAWHPSKCKEAWILRDLERGTRFFILESRGTAAGCVGMRPPHQDGCELVRLGVPPEHRHHGFGRLLVDRVIAEARAAGLKKIDLDMIAANQRLRRWYESIGFVYTGTRSVNGVPFEIGYMTLGMAPQLVL